MQVPPTQRQTSDAILVNQAVEYLRTKGLLSQGTKPPSTSVILGSGLGGLVSEIEFAQSIPFQEIPGFCASTAAGHRGEVFFGTIEGVPIMVLAGRLHRYEGWTTEQVTFPVRVMAQCGIKNLIVSNAAGGLRASFKVGEILIVRDSINRIPGGWFSHSPDRLHESPYSDELAEIALAAGRKHGFVIHQGTYLATLGPSYETRAEYRMMRLFGADCVGMSTVPEVMQAHLLGMRVLALSMISNVAKPDSTQETTHEEVLDAGRFAQPRMTKIVREVLTQISTLA